MVHAILPMIAPMLPLFRGCFQRDRVFVSFGWITAYGFKAK
jgi:hypothetical protein